jgi:hypothetical protein
VPKSADGTELIPALLPSAATPLTEGQGNCDTTSDSTEEKIEPLSREA